MILAVAAMAVACTKEKEPSVAESKLVGIWVAPLNAGGGVLQGVGGKDLVIMDNHTALLATKPFANWKITGDELVFSNFVERGYMSEIESLKYQILNFADTVMTLKGTYTYVVGDSIYMKANMSGLYQKKTPPQPEN